MRLSRSLSRISLLALAILQSGCAVMFARDEMPNLQVVHIGASRDAVEAQLGEPISEIRSDVGQPGSKRCVYKVIVREKPTQELSTAETFADKFVGFSTIQYLIIYDRSNRVLRLQENPRI